MRSLSSRRRRASASIVVLLAACGALAGCGSDTKPQAKTKVAPKYATLPPRDVPEWMKGTIMEQVDLVATDPYRVSNFGLVVMKKPTGDAVNVPNSVREYMINTMVKRSFGSKNQPGFENAQPEAVLRDPRVAIVRVDTFIPPGAVKGQRIDAYVTALPDSNTTSLAGGALYTTDLVVNGANLRNPGSGIDVLANARGYVFVNPDYILDARPDDAAARRGLLSGVILNGARVNQDRPIGLRIRAAESRITRGTEKRIDQLLGRDDGASAKDEALVFANVPPQYRGDWEHFAGLILHTYYNAGPAFVAMKAKELAAEAAKPGSDAVLLDISYAIEALGKQAIPHVESLLYSPRQDVAFAAARALAWLDDSAAEASLTAMARDVNNPFRVTAVQTLAALPTTPSITMTLRDLVGAPDALVRIEAYRGLVRSDANAVFSKTVGDKFIIDIIDADGPPLIYATRSGMPRIAFIGTTSRLATPAFFSAMNDALTIGNDAQRADLLSIFYRGAGPTEPPVQMLSTPDLAELVARLGGEGAPGQERFDFSYGEIVALLGKLSDQRMLVAGNDRGRPASFVLQSAPGADRAFDNAPIIPDGPRPVDTQASPTPPPMPGDGGGRPISSDPQPSASVR